MAISMKEVENVALLARLKLSDQEKRLFSEQLSKILEYVDKLKELDIADVAPTTHVVPLENVFREDRVKRCLNPEEALANAPDRQEDFFRVPRAFG